MNKNPSGSKKMSLDALKELRDQVEAKYLQDTNQTKVDIEICYSKTSRWSSPPSLNDELNNKIRPVLAELSKAKRKRGVEKEEYVDDDGLAQTYYRVPIRWLKETASRKNSKGGINPHEIHQIIWTAYLNNYTTIEDVEKQEKSKSGKRHFNVYYYSYFHRRIKSFNFSINIDQEIGEASGWIEGGHDPKLEVKKIYRFEKNLIVDLAQRDGSWPFRLSLFIGEDTSMSSKKEYPGILHGFDRLTDLISTFVICLDQDSDNKLDTTAKRILHLLRGYLKLNAKTGDGDITSINQLTVRGEVLSKYLHLAGKEWLLWGVYRSREIFQSRLVIHDDLSGTLYTAQSNDLSEQKVIIDISQINERIIMQTFPSEGTQKGIICQWKMDGRAGAKIIAGVFTHGGILNELKPYSGYMVMCPLPEKEEKDTQFRLDGYDLVPIRSIPIDEKFKEMVDAYPLLGKMYKLLRESILEHQQEEETLFNLPDLTSRGKT